jgi:hypothetical protein
MALNFPDSPSLNDTYTFNNKTWTWNGTAWISNPTTSYDKTTYTATEGQTTFTASYDVGYVEVFLNGAKLGTADYTATSGTSIVLGTGAVAGDIVEVIAWKLGIVSGIDYVAKTGGTFSGDVTFGDSISVADTLTTTAQPSIYLDGNNSASVTFTGGDSVLTSTHYQQRHLRGGMSWDGTLGRVTVPTTGHYFVSFTYYETGASGRISFYKNGAALLLIQSTTDGTWGGSFVTEMSANDYFFMNAESFDVPTGFMGTVHTHFSAYLLG